MSLQIQTRHIYREYFPEWLIIQQLANLHLTHLRTFKSLFLSPENEEQTKFYSMGEAALMLINNLLSKKRFDISRNTVNELYKTTNKVYAAWLINEKASTISWAPLINGYRIIVKMMADPTQEVRISYDEELSQALKNVFDDFLSWQELVSDELLEKGKEEEKTSPDPITLLNIIKKVIGKFTAGTMEDYDFWVLQEAIHGVNIVLAEGYDDEELNQALEQTLETADNITIAWQGHSSGESSQEKGKGEVGESSSATESSTRKEKFDAIAIFQKAANDLYVNGRKVSTAVVEYQNKGKEARLSLEECFHRYSDQLLLMLNRSKSCFELTDDNLDTFFQAGQEALKLLKALGNDPAFKIPLAQMKRIHSVATDISNKWSKGSLEQWIGWETIISALRSEVLKSIDAAKNPLTDIDVGNVISHLLAWEVAANREKEVQERTPEAVDNIFLAEHVQASGESSQGKVKKALGESSSAAAPPTPVVYELNPTIILNALAQINSINKKAFTPRTEVRQYLYQCALLLKKISDDAPSDFKELCLDGRDLLIRISSYLDTMAKEHHYSNLVAKTYRDVLISHLGRFNKGQLSLLDTLSAITTTIEDDITRFSAPILVAITAELHAWRESISALEISTSPSMGAGSSSTHASGS